MPKRNDFVAIDIVEEVWEGLGLPKQATARVRLPGDGLGFPSSFKIGSIAQASIALSALAAAKIYSIRNECDVPEVTVSLRHACAEYKCERLYSIKGARKEELWGPVGGLHKTADGYVRIHDGFLHHRNGALKLLGLDDAATRDNVAQATSQWKALDLEQTAVEQGLVIAALRSYSQWDALPQAQATQAFPISVRRLSEAVHGLPPHMKTKSRGCLEGLRVLELSRVIAAPVAGKTLAAHGADVLWITSPNLPHQPALDREFSRGKRSVRLDLDDVNDRQQLLELVKTADVFIQSYRPGSLAARGFSANDLAAINPNIIYASMSAYGTEGPWAKRRGFDSLVQTCSGMNVSEAEHYGDASPARPMPCQALDHTAGYMLATGIMAALYKRAIEGGGYAVDVSLAGCMHYLRSLGQHDGRSGFDCEDIAAADQVADLMETRPSVSGDVTYVKHSAQINGAEVGWDKMPGELGSDEATWH